MRDRVRRILSFKRLHLQDHDLDDLEQEVMSELWRAVNNPDFDFAAGFWGFVEIITARRCIDWLRGRKAHTVVPLDLTDGAQSPFDRAVDAERSSFAEDLLQALDPECRKILVMRFRDEMSYKSIAEVAGKSEGAVRVQMFRCVRRARRLMNQMTARGRARPRKS